MAENEKQFYKKAEFWVAVGSIVAILVVGFMTYKKADRANQIANQALQVAQKSLAEPKFEIAFDQVKPPDPISSQKVNGYRIFEPCPNNYDKANLDKIDGKKNRIFITNTGKTVSPTTYVKIMLKDPFSVSLVALRTSMHGWLKPSHLSVEYDKLYFDDATITINQIIGQEEELEIYAILVYPRIKRKKEYIGKDKIDDALTVIVHSSLLKYEPISTKSFPLGF